MPSMHMLNATSNPVPSSPIISYIFLNDQLKNCCVIIMNKHIDMIATVCAMLFVFKVSSQDRIRTCIKSLEQTPPITSIVIHTQ